MQLQGTGRSAPKGLVVTMTSSLGDHFQGVLAGGCIDARIRQSPKLPNRINITIADAEGKVLGSAAANDLVNRPFAIALDRGGAVGVTAHARCASSPGRQGPA